MSSYISSLHPCSSSITQYTLQIITCEQFLLFSSEKCVYYSGFITMSACSSIQSAGIIKNDLGIISIYSERKRERGKGRKWEKSVLGAVYTWIYVASAGTGGESVLSPCGELRCIVLLGRKIKICDWKTLRLLERMDIWSNQFKRRMKIKVLRKHWKRTSTLVEKW